MFLNFANIRSLLMLSFIKNGFSFENYPNTNKVKLCSAMKTTIDLRAPICIPTADGGWENRSVDNCVRVLKDQCPEFNEAECMWFEVNMRQNGALSDGREIYLMPSCRLKYKAAISDSQKPFSKKTWMEVNYVNQYGTTAYSYSDFYIVEVYRFLRDRAKDFYGHVDQDGYPKSVPNPHSAGGYDKTIIKTVLDKSFDKPLCPRGQDVDNLCRFALKDHFIKFIIPNKAFKDIYYKDNPSSVIAFCSTEVITNDNSTSGLAKIDVCKITHKVIDGVTMFNYLICTVVKSNTNDSKPDSQAVSMDFHCYITFNGTLYNVHP